MTSQNDFDKYLLSYSCLFLCLLLFITLIKPGHLKAANRDLAVRMEEYGLSRKVKRWAVVIGISEYQDEKIDRENPIEYAHQKKF